MKNLGYKFSLLAFFVAMLSGFYMRLSLWDNLIRSFVFYLIFSAVYLVAALLINQMSLDSIKQKREKKGKSKQEKLENTSPNLAK